MQQPDQDGVGCFVAVILGVGLAISVMIISAQRDSFHTLRKDAVDRGFAEYNRLDGKWQWRDLKAASYTWDEEQRAWIHDNRTEKPQ